MDFNFLTFILVLLIFLSLHIIGLIISFFFVKKYKTINIDGYNIHYRSSGSGPKKVVLFHGMFSSLNCWDNFLNFKSPDTEYISIDLPQMSESITPKKVAPVEQIEDIVFKLCKALQLNNPDLVGCSLGGLVAYLSCLKYPGYFKRCVIIASPFDSKILYLPIYKISFLAPILNLFVNPIIVMTSYKRIANAKFSFSHCFVVLSKFRSPIHFKSSLEYLRLISRVEQNLRIPQNVENFYFIWGTKDHLVKKSRFKEFIGSNKRLNYDEIPDASHHPMESHPKEFSITLAKIIG